MIWIFDSWFGWLSVLKELRKILPQYDYIYFWDSLNAPYWEKNPEEIKKLTVDWIKFLFDNWAKLVILACNTAMVHSIKDLQQNIFFDKKILWVTIPGAEKVVELWYKKIWVLATSSTVKYWAYKNRVHILNSSIIIQEIEAPKIVPLIEKWEHETLNFNKILKSYISLFDKDIEGLVLWCTHYTLISDKIRNILPEKTTIIDPSFESSIKFQKYLENHKDIEERLLKNWRLEIYTSWNYNDFKSVWKHFFDFDCLS